MPLMFRIHVAADGFQAALAAAGPLIELIERHSPIARMAVEKYWKFEEQFEVTFDLDSGDGLALFAALRGAFAEAWHDQSEDEAIWDVRMHGPAASSHARWAHLEWTPSDLDSA